MSKMIRQYNRYSDLANKDISMKIEKILSLVSKIYGILITLCLLGLFGPKLIGSIDKITIARIFNWDDNPTGFILRIS